MVWQWVALALLMLAIVGLVATLDPLLALLVVGSVVPVAIAQRRINIDLYAASTETTTADRQRRYVRDLLSEPETAKEVRAYGLAGYLLDRHRRVGAARLSTLGSFHARAVVGGNVRPGVSSSSACAHDRKSRKPR